MQNYTPTTNNDFSVRSTSATTLEQIQIEQMLKKAIAMTQDTITSAQAQKAKKGQQVQIGQRPSLPQASKSAEKDYLAIVAKAFSSAFDAVSKGTIEQTQSYVDLQKLDQTMSQSVLLSTKHAIQEEQKQAKLQQTVSAQMKKAAHQEKIISDVFWGLTALFVAVPVLWEVAGALGIGAGAAVATGEAVGEGTAAATAGEVVGEAGVETGAGTAEAGAESVTTSEGEASVTTDMSSSEANPVTEGDMALSTGTESANPEEIAQSQIERETEQNTTNQLDQAKQANAKSEVDLKEKWKKLGKKLTHVGISAVLGTPSLVTGIQQMQNAKVLEQTAKLDKQVGAAVAIMQQNNDYYQFYQQLIQRAGKVLQEETNGASQIIGTYGDITNAYRAISTGLANAV